MENDRLQFVVSAVDAGARYFRRAKGDSGSVLLRYFRGAKGDY
jgi:hypothetical protein